MLQVFKLEFSHYRSNIQKILLSTMSSITYPPTPSPTPERRPIKNLRPAGLTNKKQFFESPPSPVPDNIFLINANSSFSKKQSSYQPSTSPFGDNFWSTNSQFPASPSENKSSRPRRVSNPSLSPKSPISSNIFSDNNPNFESSPGPQPATEVNPIYLSATNLFSNKSPQPGKVSPLTIFSNNVSSGPFRKPPSPQITADPFRDDVRRIDVTNKSFQFGKDLKGPSSPQPTIDFFGRDVRSPIPQLPTSLSTNKGPHLERGFNSNTGSPPTIFSDNVNSGPFKKLPSFQPATGLPENNAKPQLATGSPTNKGSQPGHIFGGLPGPQPTTGLFRGNPRSPIPQSAKIRNKGSEVGKIHYLSPTSRPGGLRASSPQPVVDQVARPPSPTDGTTASITSSGFAGPGTSKIEPSSSSARVAERELGQKRTRFVKISPPTTLQLPDEASQKKLVAEFVMGLNKLTEDQAFEHLAKLSEGVSSLRLDIVKRLVESQFDCLMDWTWTIPTANNPPPIINRPATDSDSSPINGLTLRSTGSLAVKGDLSLSKPQFFSSLRTAGSSRIDIGTRIQGWCRQGSTGRILFVQYGLEENFLCEIVPGAKIGNLVLAGLEDLETLTKKQETQGIDSWGDHMRVTNVAISQSITQPRIWVCINNSAWMSRTKLAKLRIENGTRPLGKQSATDCIMQCVEEKAGWYREAGYAEEADRYQNQFSFLSN